MIQAGAMHENSFLLATPCVRQHAGTGRQGLLRVDGLWRGPGGRGRVPEGAETLTCPAARGRRARLWVWV